MGISGIAIKANAQTALGSLWPISDKAAVKLMTTFYHQLMVEHKSKAKALQIAQLQLINDPEMNDPLYWAPFILVGHWL
jgi:CHAT domain-containing protein